MTATSSPTPVLQARGLVKRYGQVTAIDGADFDLLPGEVLAVIGDNGAGKTSMIKALTGALVPDAGEIRLHGEPITLRLLSAVLPSRWYSASFGLGSKESTCDSPPLR